MNGNCNHCCCCYCHCYYILLLLLLHHAVTASFKIIAKVNLGLASADSRRRADVLEFVGSAVEREQFLPKLAI